MNVETVRRSPRKFGSRWKTKKEDPNKIRNHPGGQRQHVKKKEMTHIKGKKEEREGTHKKLQREKYIEWEL